MNLSKFRIASIGASKRMLRPVLIPDNGQTDRQVNSSNLLQITTENTEKSHVFNKNETCMLSRGWMEIGVLFSAAYARSVRRSPARMPKMLAPLVNCIVMQWCSGRR